MVPMPVARMTTAMTANPGLLRRERKANFKFRLSPSSAAQRSASRHASRALSNPPKSNRAAFWLRLPSLPRSCTSGPAARDGSLVHRSAQLPSTCATQRFQLSPETRWRHKLRQLYHTPDRVGQTRPVIRFQLHLFPADRCQAIKALQHVLRNLLYPFRNRPAVQCAALQTSEYQKVQCSLQESKFWMRRHVVEWLQYEGSPRGASTTKTGHFRPAET